MIYDRILFWGGGVEMKLICVDLCVFSPHLELPEKQEQLQAIYKVLEQLPSSNFNTLERLVFHLVRSSSPKHF